jgi:hypothetical protein
MHRGAPISEALYNMNKNLQQNHETRKKYDEEMAQKMIEEEVSKTVNN